MDFVEALGGDAPVVDRQGKTAEVAVYDGPIDHPPGPPGVASVDGITRQGEDDRDRGDAGGFGKRDERPSSVTLDVRGVDDDEPARGKTTSDLAMEDREHRARSTLVRLVPAEQRAERVRGEHFLGVEVASRERRLACPGCADKHHQGWVPERDRMHAAPPACYSAPDGGCRPRPVDDRLVPIDRPSRVGFGDPLHVRVRPVERLLEPSARQHPEEAPDDLAGQVELD